MKRRHISPYGFLHNSLRGAGFMINADSWATIYSYIHIVLMSGFASLAVLEVIFGDEDNLVEIVLSLSSVVISIQVCAKLIVMLVNERKVRILIERLEKYREDLLDNEENHNQIIEADKTCVKYSKFYITFCTSFPIISFFANYKDFLQNPDEIHLTHKLWIPWNMKELWGYTAGSFSILVMTMSSVIIYASCGVFQFTLTFQISTYLKILQNQIETKGGKDKTIYLLHSNVTQFIQAYNDIFSGQLLIELMVASLMPCGYSYTIIKGIKSNNPPPLDIYHNLLLTLVGPFIMYLCGQEICTQMERLHDSSYYSKWYEEKPKVRKDLYTMMLVTVRPMKPNYRLFITFDMKCCTTVMQGLYSYLMMIIHFETA